MLWAAFVKGMIDLQSKINLLASDFQAYILLLSQEGSNSASGSVCACHVAAPASIPIVHGRGLWRFTSRPSTLETVYLSWLTWPRKGRSCLTDIEWDVKEPLRTTSCLAVTTLSVPIHLKYILHIHAGHHGAVTMACAPGLKGLGYGSQLPRRGAVSLGKTLHLYVHSLNPGVNGDPVGQWLLNCVFE